jgi:FKBP-type peptidyl-prolyl cis-trans isomerase 2
MEQKVKEGDEISVHYLGTLETGEKFDSSYDRGQTLDFKAGAGQMIKGFDKAVIGMGKGEKKSVVLQPEEAYGLRDESKIVVVGPEKFENFEMLQVGMQVNGGGAVGVVLEKNPDNVKIDFNHFLAGKKLNFEIELVAIKE